MKKVLSLAAVCLFVLALCSCGSSNTPEAVTTKDVFDVPLGDMRCLRDLRDELFLRKSFLFGHWFFSSSA